MTFEVDAFVAFAEELAALARDRARAAFAGGAAFTTKSDGSPVTELDQAIEREMRALIVARFPDHGILGEEYGTQGGERDLVWVLDPIDGTKCFAAGLPTFGSLIALCHEGVPIVGVVELPVMQHRCVGARGRPTTLNGRPVRTRAPRDLESCVMSAAGSEFYRGPAPRAGFDRLSARTQWNVYGGGCVSYASLAGGYVDICLEGANLSTFDYCAYVPVVEGAGGAISDWHGGPLRLVIDPAARAAGVVATADLRIHALALDCINGR
ncbi:MAG: phosphatase [Alphaproteobacteria bacterium]|nr:phosphatase [Alphaproteobacteria bacterium]